ncbi:hypothetical protein D3C71_1639680 [compost metagenome]
MQQFNALGGVEISRTKQQIGRLDLAEQIGFGQWRALVGQAWLIADQGDAPVKAFLAQGGSDLKSGLASTDDND